MSTVKLVAGASVAYSLFRLTSHPKAWLYHRIPKKKIKNVHVLPSIRIARRDKEYHLHHWMNATAFYVLYFLKKRFTGSKFFHGFMIGAIIQGLTYKDRFSIVQIKSRDAFQST